MKRVGNLFPQICDYANLLQAAYRSRLGKRYRPDVAAFHFRLEDNLLELAEELRTKTYRPGPYRDFFITDPKRRLISAAPYRDRVVHHALCQVIEPVFERMFIHSSYANRPGKGTHAALNHATRCARRFPYVSSATSKNTSPASTTRSCWNRWRARSSARKRLGWRRSSRATLTTAKT